MYTEEQQLQIDLGKEMNLDTSIYENENFNPCQMAMIRFGLLSNLNVSIYAKEDYDHHQMGELMQGLKSNVDITKYIDKNLSWYEMFQIRINLEKEQRELKKKTNKENLINYVIDLLNDSDEEKIREVINYLL